MMPRTMSTSNFVNQLNLSISRSILELVPVLLFPSYLLYLLGTLSIMLQALSGQEQSFSSSVITQLQTRPILLQFFNCPSISSESFKLASSPSQLFLQGLSCLAQFSFSFTSATCLLFYRVFRPSSAYLFPYQF